MARRRMSERPSDPFHSPARPPSMEARLTRVAWRRVWEDARWPPTLMAARVCRCTATCIPANVLMARGAVVGVIDFGNACAGDPALDLAAMWVSLPRRRTSPRGRYARSTTISAAGPGLGDRVRDAARDHRIVTHGRRAAGPRTGGRASNAGPPETRYVPVTTSRQ